MVKKCFLIIALFLFIAVVFNPMAMAASESQIVFADVAKKVGFSVFFPTFIPEGFKYNATKSEASYNEYRIYFTGPKGEIEIFAGRGDVGDVKLAKTITAAGLKINISEPVNNTTIAWWSVNDNNYIIGGTGVSIDDMELIANSIILATGGLPYTGIDGRWFALAFILIAIGLAFIVFNPRPGADK
ncbi:MAG: hypothetical protein IBX64_09095 [Actinobacteria bacterium]|nr:hypothetical protein [Actinomycetota bacterium]